MNSAKASSIKGITSDIKTKRMSVAPSMGVGGAALGGLGLRFNKKAKESEEAAVEPQEETESSKVTK